MIRRFQRYRIEPPSPAPATSGVPPEEGNTTARDRMVMAIAARVRQEIRNGATKHDLDYCAVCGEPATGMNGMSPCCDFHGPQERARRQANGIAHKGRPPRSVKTDRGEVFASVRQAAETVDRDPQSVWKALQLGKALAGRIWSWAE